MFQQASIRTKLLLLAGILLFCMLALAILSLSLFFKFGSSFPQLPEPGILFHRSVSIVIAFSVFVISLSMLLSFFMIRNITSHLTTVVEFAKRLSDGEYNLNDAPCFYDEAGQIVDSLKQMSLAVTISEKSFRQQAEELARVKDSLTKETAERRIAEEALRASQDYAKNIINSSLDMIIAVDTKRRIIEFNAAAQKTFGYTQEEVLGKHIRMLYAATDEATAIYQKTVETGQCSKDILNKRKNGDVFPCLLSASILRDVQGEPIGYMGISRDITSQKQAEETLRQHNRELVLLSRLSELLQACRSEEETYSVMKNMCEQFFPSDSGYLAIIDDSRNMLHIVSTWGDISPETENFEVDACWAIRLGKMHLIKPPDTGPLCSHLSSSSISGYLCAPISASGEILGILHLNFSHQKERLRIGEQSRDSIKARYVVVNRIAEHYALSLVNLRLHEALKQDAIRDELTGMYNRRYMEGSLERETRRAERHKQPVGIIMLDVDYFKHFNDTHGHEAGDAVLRELGHFFRKNTRGEDIACRYGGEEFLLIMPEASLQNTIRRAGALREGVQNLRIVHQNTQLRVTISLGVAALPEHGITVDDAVKAADAALYEAKNKGRNRVVVAL